MEYETPEICIVIFDAVDVITASVGGSGTQKPSGGGGGVILPDDNWT